MRTTVAEVTFRCSFQLPGMDQAYPPGAYRVETDEEALEGLSIQAYRRVATRLHLSRPGQTEVLEVSPVDLEHALARDAGLPGS